MAKFFNSCPTLAASFFLDSRSIRSSSGKSLMRSYNRNKKCGTLCRGFSNEKQRISGQERERERELGHVGFDERGVACFWSKNDSLAGQAGCPKKKRVRQEAENTQARNDPPTRKQAAKTEEGDGLRIRKQVEPRDQAARPTSPSSRSRLSRQKPARRQESKLRTLLCNRDYSAIL